MLNIKDIYLPQKYILCELLPVYYKIIIKSYENKKLCNQQNSYKAKSMKHFFQNNYTLII